MTRPIQSGIYVIENTVNGHFYIGSTVDLSNRKSEHLYLLRRGTHHSPRLQLAFNKYREEAFVFTLLEEVPRDKEMLFERETHWVLEFQPHYNASKVGASNLGLKFSDESLQRLSEASKAMWAHRTEEERQYHSEASKVMWKAMSEEERQRQLDVMQSKEARRKRSESLKDTWQDEDLRRRRSEQMKVQWQDEDYRRKQSERIVTDEERRKKSEASKAQWAERSDEERQRILEPSRSEEVNRKRSDAVKKAMADPDRRRKRTEALKEALKQKGPVSEEDRAIRSANMKEVWRKRREAKDQLRLPL